MSESEITRCPKCRHEYEAREMADFMNCPVCPKDKSGAGEKKPLDKVFETLMPFGKYAGTPFYKIPDSYLEWLEGELLTKKNNPELLAKISEENKRRQKNPSARV